MLQHDADQAIQLLGICAGDPLHSGVAQVQDLELGAIGNGDLPQICQAGKAGNLFNGGAGEVNAGQVFQVSNACQVCHFRIG